MFHQGTIMFDGSTTTSIVNGILLFGIVCALLGARWVGKLNKEQHAKNLAAKASAH